MLDQYCMNEASIGSAANSSDGLVFGKIQALCLAKIRVTDPERVPILLELTSAQLGSWLELVETWGCVMEGNLIGDFIAERNCDRQGYSFFSKIFLQFK